MIYHHQRIALRTFLWAATFFKVLYCLTLNNQPIVEDQAQVKSDKQVEYIKATAAFENQSSVESSAYRNVLSNLWLDDSTQPADNDRLVDVLAINSSESHGDDANITFLLDSLVKNYDKRIRPNYGGPPVEVLITAHVTTISGVSEVSMDYTVDLYLRQFWRDPRLAFKSMQETSLTIGIDMVKTIWTPDTFFPNEKKSFFHEATSHNSFLRIDSGGNVLRSIRLTVTANCPMNLHTFPLDVQVCALEIESYGYSTRDIIYHWRFDKDRSVTIDENVHLAHFKVGSHYHIERVISLSTGNYSRLTTYFTFERNIGFYLIQIYLPSSLIVVISWVSFWLNRDATQARVAIGVTTVLTMTTLMTSTNSTMPKVSYVKSIDIYLGTCFFIVFASLLEYAAVGYLMKRRRTMNAALTATSLTGDTSMALKQLGGKGVDQGQPLNATMFPFYGSVDRRLEPMARTFDADCDCATCPRRASTPNSPAPAFPRSSRHIPPTRPLLANIVDRQRSFNYFSKQRQYPLPHPVATPPNQSFQPAQLIRMDSNGSHSALPLIEPATASTVLSIEPTEMKATKAPNSRRRSRVPCFIRPSAIDKWSRILFPLIFVLFHCVYWTVYINMV